MTPGEDYLAAVRADVPAWSFRRAGMLREICDGLDDATAGQVDLGLDPAAAERAAVAEFGPAEVVAASIRAELAVEAGRVAVLVAGIASAAQMVIAEMLWSGAHAGGSTPPGWYGAFAQVMDVLGMVALVAGVGMAALLGRSPQLLRFVRRFDRVRAARVAGIVVMITVALQSAAGIVLTVYGPGVTALASVGPAESMHSVALPILEVLLAVQCLRLASGGAGKQDGPDHAAERLPLTPA